MTKDHDLFKQYCQHCKTETYWVIFDPDQPVSEIKCIEHILEWERRHIK